MGRKSLFDHEALAVLLLKQNGVITRGQARDCGMSRHALEHRVRVGGPWQPLLPGVYMTNTGTPTGLERLQAALLYAGPGSVITGPAALALHHIRARQILVVDVLIPRERKRRSLDFVRVHRTSRIPGSLFRMGEVSYVSPARAVADTVGGLRDISQVRAIVAEGVSGGDCKSLSLRMSSPAVRCRVRRASAGYWRRSPRAFGPRRRATCAA